MQARQLITDLVKRSVAPLLRSAGFRKEGFSFYRRLNQVTQVVNVQLSQTNIGEQGSFYINIGLQFDQICLLEGQAINPRPKEYQCQFRHRLEGLLPDVPAQWAFRNAEESQHLAMPLQVACERLIVRLDQVDSIEGMLAQNWLQHGTDLGLRAQIHYLLGNHPDAINALQQEMDFFRNRPHWNLDAALARRGLTALRPFVS